MKIHQNLKIDFVSNTVLSHIHYTYSKLGKSIELLVRRMRFILLHYEAGTGYTVHIGFSRWRLGLGQFHGSKYRL
jgi:hypothetical protein